MPCCRLARQRRSAIPASLKSPQFNADDCTFRNPPNPDAKPGLSSWQNWRRFLLQQKKEGTVPVDPIPVRMLERAALDALVPAANHIIRLGHSSHLLKLRGKWWLIDPVFGPRASPVSFAGPKRFHPPPLAAEDLPPIEAMILSHDHYDHLDVPTIEVLKDRVQRYFVPLGVGAHLRRWGVPAERIEEFDWWQQGQWGEVVVTAAPAQHFSGRTLWDRNRRCGPRGPSRAAPNASSSAATRATSPASARSASGWGASTSP